MRSVKFEVWTPKSAVCSVRCGVSREGHGRDRASLNYRSFMFGKLPPPACPGLCYYIYCFYNNNIKIIYIYTYNYIYIYVRCICIYYYYYYYIYIPSYMSLGGVFVVAFTPQILIFVALLG